MVGNPGLGLLNKGLLAKSPFNCAAAKNDVDDAWWGEKLMRKIGYFA